MNEVEKVNHPTHYNQHPSGIECIDLVEEFNFNFGNAIKYLWRCGKKNNVEASEDIRKAKFYIDREFDRLKKVHKPEYITNDMLNSITAYKMSKNLTIDISYMIEKIISSDPNYLLSKVLKSVISNEDPRIHFQDLK